MRYELLWQSLEAHAAYAPERLEALLKERGATERPDGALLWRLKAGEVEVMKVLEAGLPAAHAVKVPLSDRLELIRECMVEALALAEATQSRLVDPQLNRELKLVDEGAVADSYLRAARYAGEYLGVSEALMASYSAPVEEGLKPGTKVLLSLIGLFVLAYLLLTKISCGPEAEPPAPVNGPPKIFRK